ncbi:SDR family oxidoreductase [Streptomyces phaeochromogenes]|uniref:SDR family oxidoreductase n=1 Tax=Streptomyces phaeochromogenes TaxID=1923 RepID=UPI00324686BB
MPIPNPVEAHPTANVQNPEVPGARPQPRVAVITGGSRGIGRQSVARLAADGFAVVAGYSGNADLAEAAVKEVTAAGGRAIAVRGDVADENDVSALFDLAESTYGGVDVVVHAAGRAHTAAVVDLDLADLDALHRTNIRGTFVVAQQAARRIRPGGTIITFSTSVVGLAFPTYGAYSASKGAVEALTMILARELRGRDVTANAVAPGPTATDLFLDGKDEETIARLAAQPPLERLGTPADIAETVAFLASPAGHWINGQVVRANGGIV